MKRVVPLLVLLALSALLLTPTFGQNQPRFDPKILDTLTARCIGPANMSGRVVTIAGVESDPKTVYVATASGGLWKTTDSGDTWKCVFEKESSICLGDVAVSKSNPNIVWVGTGEHNPRNSVAWGDGVYKSMDGGKTWQHMGLKDSHTIGRIAIHPANPNIVYVAALGHIWGPNKERGIFKTTNGGKTWEVSKFLDENTGFVDLRMDPEDPSVLYAAAWCMQRDGFSGGNPAVMFGPHAGLYRTGNGGQTWEKMTDGLPANQFGRCGLDIYRNNPNVVYAVVQTDKTPTGNANQGGQPNDEGGPENGGIFRSDDKGKTWKHVNTLNPRPMYYGQVRVDPNDDKRIYVLGAPFFVSDDSGKSFAKSALKGVHGDHHGLWVNPKDSNEVWLGNDGGVYRSKDKTKTFEPFRRMAIGQFYAVSVDMSKPYYVYGGLQDNGSWGGPSANYSEGGIRLEDWFRIGGGDGFHTQCDPTDVNTVYCESQYGRPMRVDVKSKGKDIKKDEPAVKKDEPGAKKDDKGDQKKDDKGDQKKDDQGAQKKGDKVKGEPAVKKTGTGKGSIAVPGKENRWNWSSPMLLSPHDPKTIFYGSQYLYVSPARGDKWTKISPDLTYGEEGKGPTWAHTLFTIGESPKKKGVIWTGSDDGRINVSKDGGANWTDVSNIPGVAKDRCVSRVEPSHFEEGGCYVSITRYRNDDRKPYVFKTSDYGQTWTNLTSNLPESGSVHVVRQSSRNKNLLFAGTEFGLFTSLDDGKTWHRLKGGLPTVAVHDVVIHSRDRELAIGTHGRSIYIMDVAPLEEMTPEMLAKAGHLFAIRPTVAYKPQPSPGPTKDFVGQNPTYGAVIHYYLRQGIGKAELVVEDRKGKEVARMMGNGQAGLHQVIWNLGSAIPNEAVPTRGYVAASQDAQDRARGDRAQATLVPPGEYVVSLQVGGQTLRQTIIVEGGDLPHD